MELLDYLRAGYGGLAIETRDESRANTRIIEAVRGYSAHSANGEHAMLVTWSATKGGADYVPGDETAPAHDWDDDTTDMASFLFAVRQMISQMPSRVIVVMYDAKSWLEAPRLRRLMKDIVDIGRGVGLTIILVGQEIFPLSKDIESDFMPIDLGYPQEQDLSAIIDIVLVDRDKPDDKMREQLCEAGLGLTLQEFEDSFALSLVCHKGEFCPTSIVEAKAQVLKKAGLLSYYPPEPGGLNAIGGLEGLKEYLRSQSAAFTPEARRYGLPWPRGILVAGITGCGKSLTAKAASRHFGYPLLNLDMGTMMAGLVGQSESNIRRALSQAEAFGRAILWIDEIEKGITGAMSGLDSGASARVLGYLLTWMQERQSSIWVVATCNDPTKLPPEMICRFDTTFWVDLPQGDDIEQIVRIEIAKVRGPEIAKQIQLPGISKILDGFSGREIASIVNGALTRAFCDSARECNIDDITLERKDRVPVSKAMSAKIKAMQDWGAQNARPADTKRPKVSNGRNKRSIASIMN